MNKTKIKIFIIDDEINILETLNDLLSLDAYSVKSCSNPLEAIEIIKKWKPEIILSDILMPKLDGFELLKKIRDDKEINHIPVIFLTAKNIDENYRKAMDQGVDDYITKPFIYEDIVNAIQSRINRFRDINKTKYFDLKSENQKYVTNNVITPMYGIIGSLDFFSNIDSNLKSNDKNDYFSVIEKSEYKLNRTFQNILLLKQRLKTENEKIIFYETKVEKIISDTIFELCNIYDIEFSRFKLNLKEKYVNINPIDLSFILFELLSNAIKFSDQHASIEIKTEKLKNHTQIVLKDYGRGFSTAELKSVAPLNQFDIEKTNNSSLGLGLTLCKKLISKLDGELKIQSKKNIHTKVYIKIPIKE